MIYPTINQLTQDKYNRYQLTIATAKCARLHNARQHPCLIKISSSLSQFPEA